MKGCAIAFNILGMVVTIISSISNISLATANGMAGLVGTYVFLIIACIVTGTLALVTLGKNKKSIAIGVLALLFNGLIGGILYLCWKPQNY